MSLDYSHNNDSQTRQKDSTSFGKTKLISSFANLNAQKDYGKKEEGKILNSKSSTLSLHIAVYENLNDAISVGPFDDKKDRTNKKKGNISSIKSWKVVKEIFKGSASVVNLQYVFELPRQQQNQNNDPEVMQFKASQRLSNVNGAPSSNNDEHVNITRQNTTASGDFQLQSSKQQLVQPQICPDIEQTQTPLGIDYGLPQRKMSNCHRDNFAQQNVLNEAIFMNSIFDRFKSSDNDVHLQAEPRQFPHCKISITNLLENGTFLITDDDLHYELITKGWFGNRYEAQFDVELDEKILLKGEFAWALTAEELVYLACEREIFEVTYSTRYGIESYTTDELYQEIISRNLTDAYHLNVYCKLRSLGYIVRSDNNYGGLFTIYEGNPAEYHALAIIFDEKDEILEYSAFLRVGNTVSKAVIVPSLITPLDLIGPDYSDLEYVEIHYTLYDMERPEGLALAFN